MPVELPYPLPVEQTLIGLLGFELLESGEDRSLGRVQIDDRHKQVLGLVHGGVYAALAETLASEATARAVAGDGFMAQGMSNDSSFLRPVFGGTVHAEARRRHRGRTTWVWEVDFTDDQGRLCAISRVTVAVREAPAELKALFSAQSGS